MRTNTRLSYYFFVFLSALVTLSSCSYNNNITSSFGKRKYTKGYFANIPTSAPKVNTSIEPQHTQLAAPAEPIISIPKQTALVQQHNVISASTISSSTGIKPVSEYTKSNSKLASIFKVMPLAGDTAKDTGEDDYYKEKRTNRILGIVGFTVAVAGAVTLFIPSFILAVILLLAGLVINDISIRRGSNSLFAFAGFIISILGVFALLVVLIAVRQG